MKVINLVADYEVAAGEVTLSVIVGDAQIGSSIVKVGSREIARGVIVDAPIGAGAAISGQPLFVKSVVTDVNDSTNHTSVTYVLRGGRKDQQFQSAGTVDENGDSIIYRAKFNLV
jgi:hypothetical protein